MPSMQELAKLAARGQSNPANPWEHGKYLLENEQEVINEFHKLFDSQIRLANLNDEKLLSMHTLQMYNIAHMLDMSLREPAIIPVFRFCYYCWKGGLGLTRAFNHLERDYQAQVGYGGQNVGSDGYGMGYATEEEGQLFDKLAGLRPKPRANRFDDSKY